MLHEQYTGFCQLFIYMLSQATLHFLFLAVRLLYDSKCYSVRLKQDFLRSYVDRGLEYLVKIPLINKHIFFL